MNAGQTQNSLPVAKVRNPDGHARKAAQKRIRIGCGDTLPSFRNEQNVPNLVPSQRRNDCAVHLSQSQQTIG
jgi:hypothetical protein